MSVWLAQRSVGEMVCLVLTVAMGVAWIISAIRGRQ